MQILSTRGTTAARTLNLFTPKLLSLISVCFSLQESCGMSVCNGKIFILGGRGENGEATDTILCYDPSTGIITGVAAMPRPISYHGCVTIHRYNDKYHRL